jgi:cysteine desulfurase/selenocysteine lyase
LIKKLKIAIFNGLMSQTAAIVNTTESILQGGSSSAPDFKGTTDCSGKMLIPGRELRSEFPIFSSARRVAQGRILPLSYLDSAASAQKPNCVIERISRYLSSEHANIHRGAYALSANATDSYEAARRSVASFLKASSERSIVFTRGATESINLVARSLEDRFQPGDVILLSLLEHHSNIVPWQMLEKRRGVKVVFADIGSDASLSRESFSTLLALHKPKLVSLTGLANSFGTLFPIAELVQEAKAMGAMTLVDAAQLVAHVPISVQELGADFLVFSGHKLYGPTGIGVLYVRQEMFDLMEPFQGGGDMISFVTTEGSTWAAAPQKFEAGTPAIAEAIALGEAVNFVQALGWNAIQSHDRALFDYAWGKLSSCAGVTLYGPATQGKEQISILPFNVMGVHPHDLSSVADSFNVQIRAGHHCAMPALKRLGIPSSARASIGVYSCEEDFDMLVEAIAEARRIFA